MAAAGADWYLSRIAIPLEAAMTHLHQNRRVLSLLLAAATALLLPAAAIAGEPEAVREKRDVPPFHSVRFDGSGDVDVTVGSEFSVILETAEKVLPYVRTEVQNEELIIRRKGRGGRAHLRVEITMPVMTALALNGSAQSWVHGKVDTPKFSVRIAGSGSAMIDELSVDDFGASLAGSSKLAAAGRAQQVNLDTAGSAKIQLAKLEAQNANISISGSGSADLHVADSLAGKINGSGQIHLLGSPTEMNVKTNGSGRIIQTAVEPEAPREEASE
jgi:hypothetical protein